MSLFSFSNSSKLEEVSAIFHVGSNNVNGYLIKLSKVSKPEIIYAVKVPISFQKSVDLERYYKLMILTFDSAVKNVQKYGLPHLNFTGLKNRGVRNIFYILSSPWCVSQTKIIKIKRDKSFEISNDLIEKIMNEQENNFLSSDSIEDSKLMEKRIIEAKLNGYKMDEIYGKEAREAEFALFMTSAPEHALKDLKNITSKYFHVRSHHFYSFALSSFSAIRDIYADKEDFIFLDVHGELTDLAIVKNNIFAESVSFPAGKNFFLRRISEKLRVSANEAKSLINLHVSGKCDKATSLKIQSAIDESLNDWLEKFHSVLSSVSLSMYIPMRIFMIIDDDFSDLLVKKLKEERFSQFSLTDGLFDVIVLDGKNLCEYCKSDKSLKKETFAELECVFLNKIFNAK